MSSDSDIQSKIRHEYSKRARLYEQKWSRYIAKTNHHALELLGEPLNKKILNIACGTCFLEKQILKKTSPSLIVSADLTLEMLTAAKEKFSEIQSVFLLNSEAEKLPLQEDFFDLICCVNSFHFFKNPETVLRECSRVLKSNGRLIIVDWCRDFLICKVYDVYLKMISKSHRPPYTMMEMEKLFKETSFDPEKQMTFRAGLVWGMMAFEVKKNL